MLARKNRSVVLLLAALVLSSAPASAQSPTDAKARLAAGAAAARTKDWATALREYQAAQAATPSEAALDGVAGAHYELGQLADAQVAYGKLLETYGNKSAAGRRAEARIKEIAPKLGAFTFQISETGAEVRVDDKPVGVALPVPVTAGPHKVRVTKDRFRPWEQVLSASAGAPTKVDVKLELDTTRGHLAVRETTGKKLEVRIDDAPVGETPWEGDVEAGEHTVTGRAGLFSAPAKQVAVERGKTTTVDLTAAYIAATLKVVVGDGKGNISIDGKLVGAGTFSGELAPGPHKLVVEREGFERFEDDLVLKEGEIASRTVTLQIERKVSTGTLEQVEQLGGVYGGFGLFGGLQASTMGTTIDQSDNATPGCRQLGAVSCERAKPKGAGLFGYVGYTWDPVGLEIMGGGLYDNNKETATFAGSTAPGANPLLQGPPRVETFVFHRLGGLAAVRARITLQNKDWRGSFAAGVGGSYRLIILDRTAETTDGTNRRAQDIPEAQSVLSPGLSVELSVGYRLARPTTLQLGALMWVDRVGRDEARTAPVKDQVIGNRDNPSSFVPLTTPAYDLARGAQVMLGAYIGMMFGG